MYGSIRGSRAAALAVVDDPGGLELARSRFYGDIEGSSSTGGSLLNTWVVFHNKWFKGHLEAFPITVESIEALGILLKAGGYRSAANYFSRAKDQHVAMGYRWDEFLERGARRAVRSITRGMGPARQSAALEVRPLLQLSLPWVPEVAGGPLGLKAAIVLGIMFCLREVELAFARIRHVELDPALSRITWNLPVSKGDPIAVGKHRPWGCLCGAGAEGHPCPFHCMAAHLGQLRDHFGDLDEESPVFPTAAGSVVLKAHMEKCIEQTAELLGQPFRDGEGRPRFGGHSLRVTGARWLAELGMPLVSIQLLARWDSDVVRRYIAEAPLRRLSQDYMAAAGDTHLRELLGKTEEDICAVRTKVRGLGEEIWKDLLDRRRLAESFESMFQDLLRERTTEHANQLRDEFVASHAQASTDKGFNIKEAFECFQTSSACADPLSPECGSGSARAPSTGLDTEECLWVTCADSRVTTVRRSVAHCVLAPGPLLGEPASWRTKCNWRFGSSVFRVHASRPDASVPCARCVRGPRR